MTRVVLATLVAVAAVTAVAAERTPGPIPDGMPFGRIVDEDVDHLQEFAFKRAGFDLKGEMARVYGDGGKVDEEALGRVFSFSRQFNTLDNHARTYGQIIYSSLLNIGEHIGVPAYTKILDRQPADVQQRIRDFLFYPYTRQLPKERWDEALGETHQMYPTLFPKGFRFGRNDPIFK
jgi:hypothetical protein